MIRTYAGSPARALRKKQWANTRRLMRRFWQLYLFVLPPIITTFIWHYIPLYGVVIAFKDYKVIDGILGSDWAGLEHFMAFFRDPYFEPILWNTIRISLYSFATFPCSIIFALMINELTNHKFKKTVQMISYMPHFISTVVVCAMVHMFFNVDGGIVNNAIVALGGKPVPFMYKAKYFDHLYVWSGVWQGMGWSAVIYLSALSAVDPELHEAARIDGASRLMRIRHINIPAIQPTVVILFVMSVGQLASVGYEKIYLLQNDLNVNVSEVISTYVYKRGIENTNYSFSAAVGLFNNVINIVLLLCANAVSHRLSQTSLF